MNEKSDRPIFMNIEILRILAMFMIVCSHWSYFIGRSDFIDSSIDKYYVGFTFLGNLGSDLFIMVTGYLMVKKTNTIYNVVKIWSKTFIYSVIIWLIYVFFHSDLFTIENAIKNATPIIHNTYWFVTVYMILMIFVPTINYLIKKYINDNINMDKFVLFSAIFLVIWLVISILLNSNRIYTQVITFIVLYTCGAVIRLKQEYMLKLLDWKKYMLICVSVYVVYVIAGLKDRMTVSAMFYFTNRELFIFAAIGIFLFVLSLDRLKNSNNRIIYTIGKSTFGIYLIHENPNIRNVLWFNVFEHCPSQFVSFIAYSLFACMFVFIICALTDIICGNTVRFIKTYIVRLQIVLTKAIDYKIENIKI